MTRVAKKETQEEWLQFVRERTVEEVHNEIEAAAEAGEKSGLNPAEGRRAGPGSAGTYLQPQDQTGLPDGGGRCRGLRGR